MVCFQAQRTNHPYFIIDEAKSYISESLAENKPFFAWINFWGPHTPCIVPEPYYSMYRKEDVMLDESFFKPLEGKPGHYRTISKMWECGKRVKIIGRGYHKILGLHYFD